MSPQIVPARAARAQITVAHSRFIASVSPAFSVEEARAFAAGIRREFPDASHHVPAFIIGHGAAVTEHCSDDGEPQGTAGRPLLAVLRGSGLGDAAAVVTRYFGGTKLGKGGLARAYGDALQAALAILPRAEKAAVCMVQAALPYPLLERVRRLAAEHGGEIVEETFAAGVTLTARFRVADTPAFQAALADLSHGAVQAQVAARTVELIAVASSLPARR
jgi:uncharacterized YigZ family protein